MLFNFFYVSWHYGITLRHLCMRLPKQLILRNYKAQRHAVNFERYLIYLGWKTVQGLQMCLFVCSPEPLQLRYPLPKVSKFSHWLLQGMSIRPGSVLVIFLWIFKIIFNGLKFRPGSVLVIFLWIFKIIFNGLKFMKSWTKSLITSKVLHLEHFVKICYSATFSMATTWWITWVSIRIAKRVIATLWLFNTFHNE